MFRILLFLVAIAAGYSAEQRSQAELLGAKIGMVALCRPSVMDEWQIVGDPRRLSEAEATRLGSLFAAEETWSERQADGRLLASMVFSCNDPGDFKIVLYDPAANTFAALRIWVDCRAVDLRIDGVPVKLPAIREQARRELLELFDQWFPDWRSVSRENQRKWRDELLKIWPDDKRPNKSPQRNAGSGPATLDSASPPHGASSSEKTDRPQSPRG